MDLHVNRVSGKIKKLVICGPQLFSKQFVCMHMQCYGFPQSKRPTYSEVKIHPRFSGTVPEIRFEYWNIFVPFSFIFPILFPFCIIFFRMETVGSCW
jgi:hypothetical protein